MCGRYVGQMYIYALCIGMYQHAVFAAVQLCCTRVLLQQFPKNSKLV